MSNLSQEVTAVKHDLIKSVEDTESDRQSNTSSPQLEANGLNQNALSDLETQLKELVVSHQFSKAIKTLHQIRGHFPGSNRLSRELKPLMVTSPLTAGYFSLGVNEDDDINIILSIYCNILCESRSYYLVITEPEHNPAEITRQLMDTSLQLSSTLHSFESH